MNVNHYDFGSPRRNRTDFSRVKTEYSKTNVDDGALDLVARKGIEPFPSD